MNKNKVKENINIEVEAEPVLFGIVDSIMLNVRETPDIKSNVLVVIVNGAEVRIDKSYKNDSWYKITTATGVNGYVSKEFICVKE